MRSPDRATAMRLGAWSLGVAGAVAVAGQIAVAGRIGGADAPHLLAVELRLGQLLRGGDIGHAASAWWALLAPQPPFGAVLGTLTTVLTGRWPLSAALCMGITLLILFDALQRISLALTQGRVGGLLAWAAVLASPYTWCAVEQYSRDLSVATAILQAASHVVMPGALVRRRAAVGFGAWMGVAFGVKYTAPVFLIGPCLVVGLGLVWARARAQWVGLGVALLTFVGTAGVWYATHLDSVRRYLFTSLDAGAMQGNASSLRDVDSLEAKVYYVATLWEAHSAPGIGLLVLALGIGLMRRESRFGAALLGVGALIGTVVLARTSQQVDRYLFPGFVLTCAAFVTLGRGWMLPLLTLVILVPRGVTSWQRYAPGEVGLPPSYAHGLDAFQGAQWPQPGDSFAPSDFQPEEWNLPAAVAALKSVQGPTGTVGLLIASGPTSPTFGHLLLPAAAIGCEWDWATINLRGGQGGGGVFLGPLFDGSWPSRRFHTVIALEERQTDPQVTQWLSSHPVVEKARVASRGGAFVVYSVPEVDDAPPPGPPSGPPR